jgi:uncharacterized repeat protein (TIGR03843 family)
MTADGDELTLETLQKGEITVQGEFLWGSNYTFFVNVAHDGQELTGVYKPTRGERPLWDFPTASLAHREAAAYLVSQALGWGLVPPTLYRKRGPSGPGSLQLFIDHDPEYHYFTFSDEDRQRLRPTCLFDLLINNADRKGSHVLIGKDGGVWLIDHGICFHEEDKLRTVIWDFVGEPIPETLCADLARLSARLFGPTADPVLVERLGNHLSLVEINAMAIRGVALAEAGQFPPPNPYRRPYPWPQI